MFRLSPTRLQADPNHDQRPSLTGKSIVDEIREVLEAREELYSGCAGLVADGAGSIDDVCNQILESYKSFSKGDKEYERQYIRPDF